MTLAFPEGADRLPSGQHLASPAEVEQVLVDAFPASSTRRPLFGQWRTLNQAIEAILPIDVQWLDGSYVTTKESPADVDLVTHFDGEALQTLEPAKQALLTALASGPRTIFQGCDSYWIAEYPEGHPARAAYETALAYWDHQFGHDRAGTPKGFVVVDET